MRGLHDVTLVYKPLSDGQREWQAFDLGTDLRQSTAVASENKELIPNVEVWIAANRTAPSDC